MRLIPNMVLGGPIRKLSYLWLLRRKRRDFCGSPVIRASLISAIYVLFQWLQRGAEMWGSTSLTLEENTVRFYRRWLLFCRSHVLVPTFLWRAGDNETWFQAVALNINCWLKEQIKQISCDLERANHFSLDGENKNTISGFNFYKQSSEKARGLAPDRNPGVLLRNSVILWI